MKQESHTTAQELLEERLARFHQSLMAAEAELRQPFPDAGMKPAEQAPIESLLKIVRALSAGQRGVLRALLDTASPWVPRVVLFIGKGASFVGWEGRGFDTGDPTPNGLPGPLLVPSEGDHLLARARAAGGMVEVSADGPGEALVEALGGHVPARAIACPLRVRGRTAAVLYGDSGRDADLSSETLLELLAEIGGLSLEALAARRLAAGAEPNSMPVRRPNTHPAGPDRSLQAPEDAEMQALLGDLETTPRAEARGEEFSPELQRQHADARRFASLLVSELLLYNEEAVIQGRRHRDLSRRLGKEIDRTRQAYQARVPASVRRGAHYLEDELLRVLADGDQGLLGA